MNRYRNVQKNTRKILSITALLSTALISSSVFATPSLYPNDLNLLSNIKNTTNSNLIADDSDPHTIYVMPPNEGYGYVSGLHTLTANLLFCTNMRTIAGETQELLVKAHELRLQKDDQVKTLEDFDKKISAAKQDAAQYASSKNISDLVKIDSDITQINSELTDTYASLETCKDSCEALAKDIVLKQGQLRVLLKARTQFVSQNLASARVYNQKKMIIDALTEQKSSILENYNLVITDLMKANSELMSLFATYASLEGGRASMAYRSQWNQNVSSLRDANSGFNFSLLPTQNAVVYPGVLGVSGLQGTGAVMGFETPGVVKAETGGIPFSSYPPSIDGNIVLSLLGACPMAYPDFFKFAPNSDPKNMKYGMMVTYNYPSAMTLSMTATYNMYKMYGLVKSSGTKGGLFSSHSWTNTEERNYFRDAFSVDWKSQDPENIVTDDQRMTMEREARTDMYLRLFNIAVPQAPDKTLLMNAINPPEHGSIVVADSLMRSCPGNMYCLGGAMLLKGLDAIFGSSNSSTSYNQIQDVNIKNEWSLSKVVVKPWVTTYKSN